MVAEPPVSGTGTEAGSGSTNPGQNQAARHCRRFRTLRIHRLSADLEDAGRRRRRSWHGPSVVAVGFPVGGDDRRRDEIPAAIHVVVDERLDEAVWLTSSAIIVAGERPELANERADHPLARHHEGDRGWAGTPFAATEASFGRGREGERRAKAPDDRPGIRLARNKRCD